MTIYYHQLYYFAKHILMNAGVKEDEANIVSEGLVRANFEGLDSHGISRLSIYLDRIEDGRINPSPSIQMRSLSPSALLVDGDNGLGHVVAYKSVEKGMVTAKNQGIASVAIHSSNHFGAAAYYCQQAAKEGFITIACTNTPSAMAPWGGKKPIFGTNPIAFGFPTYDNNSPVIVDMSTTIVARGKIILAAKQGEKIPDGWALDKNGKMTNNPKEALKGTILPAGGPKGAALALTVEILSSVLSGAALSPEIKSIYDTSINEKANVGHFFIFIDTNIFNVNDNNYGSSLNYLLSIMKSENSQDIRYPGERRADQFDITKKSGITLSSEIVLELQELGQRWGVPFPNVTN